MTATLGYRALAQPGRTYKYTKLTEFFCGCLHRTIDEFHLCPTHRAVKTRVEEVITDKPPAFRVPPGPPLINTSGNSISKITSISAPGQPTLDANDDTEHGLCFACLDDGEATPTRLGACGCQNSNCHYRWCGRTGGRHALYRAHVSQDYGHLTPSNPKHLADLEDDFFDIEPYMLSGEQRDFLYHEKIWLDQNSNRLTRLLSVERLTGSWSHPLTWLGWLPTATCRSSHSLQRQLVHLMCLGVIHPPISPLSPTNQLPLPMKNLQPAADTFHFQQARPTPAPPR